MRRKIFTWLIAFSLGTQGNSSELTDQFPDPSIEKIYSYFASLPVRLCDIGEHMPALRQLASECPHVTEIGLGGIISTWGILQGLLDNPAIEKTYIGIDVCIPPRDKLNLAQRLAEENGLTFAFRNGNDLHLEIEETDFLFIDSMHTYCHLTYELEKFSPKVRKYIAMHDTSEPWGHRDDAEYGGNYSEYPSHINRGKRGLWPAVSDFLRTHREWTLQERRLNCHGFTILKRVEP